LIQRLRPVPVGSRLMTARYTHFMAASSFVALLLLVLEVD
jgi:hypothetical protein